MVPNRLESTFIRPESFAKFQQDVLPEKDSCLISSLAIIVKLQGEAQDLCVLVSQNLLSQSTDCISSKPQEAHRALNISSKLQLLKYDEIPYAALIQFISEVYSDSRELSKSCTEIIGIVSDSNSKATAIIHTLASRSNRNVMLVYAQTPHPVANMNIHNILDMNPLMHYIDALVSFTEQLK